MCQQEISLSIQERKKSGVTDIKFTPNPDDDDLYRVGPIGEFENVRKAMDLVKDQAIGRGSFPGK